MLDKQFFRDEKFHPYLTQNFLLFRAYRGKPEGEEIYKQFGVIATPTVLFATADGKEIDRILGYGGQPEDFKKQIEATYQGENTLLNLTQAYEKNPTDLTIIAKLTSKYYSHYNLPKLGEFAQKILDQPDQAKTIMLHYEKDKPEVSAYEFAKFAATYSGPEAVKDFIAEFPESELTDMAFNNFGRFLYNKDQQENALKIFDDLIKKCPDNPNLVNAYLRYCTRSKTNYAHGTELADHLYKAKSGKVDFGFALSYAELLLEKGDTKGLQKVCQKFIKNNPEDATEFQMQIGRLYQNKKNYDGAFKIYESLLKRQPNHYPALYEIGRTAAFSGTNLERGIVCLKEYMQHKPEENQPTMANAYFRLGMLYEHKGDKDSAKIEYEAALKLDPNYEDAKQALEKLNK